MPKEVGGIRLRPLYKQSTYIISTIHTYGRVVMFVVPLSGQSICYAMLHQETLAADRRESLTASCGNKVRIDPAKCEDLCVKLCGFRGSANFYFDAMDSDGNGEA